MKYLVSIIMLLLMVNLIAQAAPTDDKLKAEGTIAVPGSTADRGLARKIENKNYIKTADVGAPRSKPKGKNDDCLNHSNKARCSTGTQGTAGNKKEAYVKGKDGEVVQQPGATPAANK